MTEIYLKHLRTFMLECNRDNSILHKQSAIKKFDSLKKLLRIIYNPFYRFNITGDSVYMYNKDIEVGLYYEDIFELLNDLHTKHITGDVALQCCKEFIEQYSEFEDEIIKILNKDLECGIGIKTINKVYPKLIPTFNPPLAKDYKKGLCDFDKEEWYYSRKLDGVRCLCFITENDVKFYSRNGKEFFTLDVLKSEILKDFKYKDFILDGEVCIVKDGKENFKSVIKEIRRKNYTPKNLVFCIFDIYSIDEFKFGKSDMCCPTIHPFHSSKINLLNQNKIRNNKHFLEIIKTIPESWEGIMLKRYPTQFKRSNNLLKFKKFKEIELKVIGVTTTTKRIDNEDKTCVGSLKCVYKNNIVEVGSGLSDNERLRFFHYPNRIINKIITVKYFEESKNKKGEHSLRFPIFKGIRNYD